MIAFSFFTKKLKKLTAFKNGEKPLFYAVFLNIISFKIKSMVLLKQKSIDFYLHNGLYY